MKTVRICFWNVNGLSQEFLNDDICGNILKKNDIVLLCETWANSMDTFYLDGFYSCNYARVQKHKNARRCSGGLYLFIRNSIMQGIEILHNRDDLIAWIKLDKTFFGLDKDLFVANAYVVPSNSPHVNPDTFDMIQEDISNIPFDCNVLICADFNAHTNDSQDYIFSIPGNDHGFEDLLNPMDDKPHHMPEKYKIRTSLDKRPLNDHGRKLLDLCKTSGLLIVNGRIGNDFYTRVGKDTSGVVDYMLSSLSLLDIIENFTVQNKLPESDHLALEITINCQAVLKYNLDDIQNIRNGWSEQYKYIWNKVELEKLKPILHDNISLDYINEFRKSIVNLETTDEVAGHFDNFINQACQRLFPLKKCKPGKKVTNTTWFDKECKELRSLAVKSGERIETEFDRVNQHKACARYKACKQRKKRKHRENCIAEINNIFLSNSSNIWKELNKYQVNQTCINQPSIEDFFKHFSMLSVETKNDSFDDNYLKMATDFLDEYDKDESNTISNNLENNILNDNFTLDEIMRAINSLKNNKSPGADFIPPEFLKNLKFELAGDLCELYNYIIEKRSFPSNWAEGIKSSIYKKGDRTNVDNYRGITVPKVFEKVFEILVNNRLEFLNAAFNRVDEFNGGFLKGKRTSDNIFILNGLIQKQLLLGKKLYVCFIDFSKAFDLVNRRILFFKLIKGGWHGRVIDTLRDLYSKTHYRVKSDGKLSPVIENLIGVNQGGNVSGLLFRKYMADMSDYLAKKFGIVTGNKILAHLLWADDLILLSDTIKGQNRQLKGLSKFCSKNQMLINLIKTKSMVFGSDCQVQFQFNDEIIEQVNEYKFVGCIFNSIRKAGGDVFKLNYDYLCDQANKAIFSAKRRLNRLGYLPPETMFYLFNSLVRPILTYASDIWAVNKLGREKIDKGFLQFAKRTLGVKQSTSTSIVFGETGQFPPSLDSMYQTVNFLNRVSIMEDSDLVKQVYMELKILHECGFITWFGKAWELVDRFNLDIGLNNSSFKKHSKKQIQNYFIQDWKQQINDIDNNPILRTYNLIKHEYYRESYLKEVSNSKYRHSITKLTTRSHDILSKKGRHSNLPLELRICPRCNIIEDEIL